MTFDIALIFAAGRGERLYPLTAHTPKPLVCVRNKPLIAYHLNHLKEAGFQHVIINHAYLGGQIRRYVGNGSSFGLHIEYLYEPPGGLETGGTLSFLQERLNQSHTGLFTLNADIFTDYCFSSSIHLEPNINGHLILVPRSAYFKKGDFGLNGQQQVIPGQEYIFSGLAYYRLSAFKNLPIARISIREWLQQQIGGQQLTGEVYYGSWQDIGTPERLHALEFVMTP